MVGEMWKELADKREQAIARRSTKAQKAWNNAHQVTKAPRYGGLRLAAEPNRKLQETLGKERTSSKGECL